MSVFKNPRRQELHDEFSGYTGVRFGVYVTVVHNERIVWEKDVWQRGPYLPWRPFYAWRIKRAIAEAERVDKAYG